MRPGSGATRRSRTGCYQPWPRTHDPGPRYAHASPRTWNQNQRHKTALLKDLPGNFFTSCRVVESVCVDVPLCGRSHLSLRLVLRRCYVATARTVPPNLNQTLPRFISPFTPTSSLSFSLEQVAPPNNIHPPPHPSGFPRPVRHYMKRLDNPRATLAARCDAMNGGLPRCVIT